MHKRLQKDIERKAKKEKEKVTPFPGWDMPLTKKEIDLLCQIGIGGNKGLVLDAEVASLSILRALGFVQLRTVAGKRIAYLTRSMGEPRYAALVGKSDD